jgi:SAM-dependent methyltransferase
MAATMSTESKVIDKEFDPSIIKPAFLIRKCLLKYIKKYAPELKGSVMDFGCGSKPYRPLLINATEYIGVDFQGEGHSHENEIIDVYYDGQTLPFENNRFDGIFTSEVFEHVFNLEHMVGELNRVLKTGG